MPVDFEHEAEPFWVLAQAYPGAGDLTPLEREVVAALGVDVVIDSRQATFYRSAHDASRVCAEMMRRRPGLSVVVFDPNGAVLVG